MDEFRQYDSQIDMLLHNSVDPDMFDDGSVYNRLEKRVVYVLHMFAGICGIQVHRMFFCICFRHIYRLD